MATNNSVTANQYQPEDNTGFPVVGKNSEKILENLPALVCLIDSEFNLLFSSKTLQMHTDRTTAPKCYAAIWGRDNPCQECQSLDVFLTGKEQTWEYRQEDEGRTYQITDKPFTGASGVPLLLKMRIDITAQKKAEAASQAANSLLEKIVACLDEAVLVVNRENRAIVSCNPAITRMFGYTPRQIIDKDYSILLKNDASAKALDRRIETFLQQEEIYRGRIALRRSTGSIMDAEISVTTTTSSTNATTQLLFVIKDISRRKRIEDETIKSQKLESLGVLAGGIAHDFNNLLTVILGNISLTKILSNLDPKTKKLLNNAEEASLRARDLTSQLLSVTKTSAPHRGRMQVADFLVQSTKIALSGSNIRYDIDLAADLDPVEVDEQQITQAIQNIIVNSRDAMPEGGNITVTARNVTLAQDEIPLLNAGKYVAMAFTDNGVGIAPENMLKIFDPYFSNKHRGNQKGMGLGLTIAYSIVKKHGGTITVESEKNNGTTVYIYLPAMAATSMPEVDTLPPPVNASAVTPTKGTILIMDDEAMVRDVVKSMLNLLGYLADSAATGQEAIDMYAKAIKSGTPYQAVVLDLTVPGGMGAEQTIVQLKNLDPRVNALVITGYSAHPIMQTPELYGFKGAMEKPIKIRSLESSLFKLFTKADQ